MTTLTANPTRPPATADDPVLAIRNLRTVFDTEAGTVRAVDGVDLTMQRGSILALVGESGCGKSVTAYSVLRLIRPPGRIASGSITIHPGNGEAIEVTKLPTRSPQLFHLRGGVASMIFQEPMTALSPVHTIGNQIMEAIRLHQPVTKHEARRLAAEMLGKVGIPNPEVRLDQYPHELSGGMRQRAMIAMALVCKPQLLIADEPTTALDVTIQAQILQLIKDLQAEMNTSVLLIMHDVGVVAQTADNVAVMYLGRVVETGSVREVLKDPRHPYTQGLLASLPSAVVSGQRLPSIPGSVPALTNVPAGCPFHPRCPHAQPGRCDQGGPPPSEALGAGRAVACLRHAEIYPQEPGP